MTNCWAITQGKGRRCGKCTGDCDFKEYVPRKRTKKDGELLRMVSVIAGVGAAHFPLTPRK